MKKILIPLAACLALIAGMAQAHGPSRLKTDQSVTLNAPVDEVWAVIGSFEDMDWLPGVASIEATGNEKGATRTRNMEDGVVLQEELLKLDPEKHAISTRLTEDNLDYVAATNYAQHITIADQDGKALVQIKGAFYRAFPQNDPPADQNDEASTASVEALHQDAINALIERFGVAE
ncbi:SRPBCC family protein [Paracoccus caeni]|uniref:SRPBCC family protein n=1 Tax=Paracoccus caeni TaxID=657651 RepID=A0A934W2X3_9RHOB|nr:SRPBCC family protein [Paracoccus caeni]MBK4218204.1 SRPBCC family protein [Paracoccus caeni]